MRKFILLLTLLASVASLPITLPARAQAPCPVRSFPTAMGFGECASGGRFGAVYYVTSFADSGPNTLRELLTRPSPKTILFAYPGNIELQSDLVIDKGNVTIIGLPWSPTITGASVIVTADNVVLRHLAIKVGSRNGFIENCPTINGSGVWLGNSDCSKDALFLDEVSDIMLDHLSLYWSTDEILSANSVERVTVSNTIIAEPLHWSLRHDENCEVGEICPTNITVGSPHWKLGHGRCQRWRGSKKVSILGSLFMNCYERGVQTNSKGDFDTKLLLGNNVFYDYYQHGVTWNDNDNETGMDAQFVFYNNYFVAPHAVAKNETLPFDPPGFENSSSNATIDLDEPKNGSEVELWLKGNYEEGGERNCELLDPDRRDDNNVDCHGLSNLPGFVDDADPIPFLPADASMSNLFDYLQYIGRRQQSVLDNDDLSRINAVLSGQNRSMINQEPVGATQGSAGGHSLGCVPGSGIYPATSDTDCDGIPDDWEQSHGLNPWDASDGPMDSDGDGYTHLEEWIHQHAT